MESFTRKLSSSNKFLNEKFIDRCIKNFKNKLHVPKVVELTAAKEELPEGNCYTLDDNRLKFEI